MIFRKTIVILEIFSMSFIFSGVPSAYGDNRVYSIQLAAFKNYDNVVKRINELKRFGHNAFYRHETVRGKGRLYRVYIEKFDSKEQAENEARILKELELISGYSVKALNDKRAKTSDKRNGDPNAGNYYLHVGSYKTKVNAENEVQRLLKSGHDAFMSKAKVLGENWFRVCVGGFKDEKEARKMGSDLQKKGVIFYFKPLPFSGK
jgi:cell division septation protein DedD